jgi:LAS superfamily LD-carboxypeptidase LdcB
LFFYKSLGFFLPLQKKFMLKKQDIFLTLMVMSLLGCVWASNNSSEDKIKGTESAPKTAKEKEKTAQQLKEESIRDTTSVAYLMGKFDPVKHPDFVKIAAQYTDKKEAFLRKETYEAFLKMAEAAAKDKVQLKILSATRNFDRQKKIWEDKWSGLLKVEDGTNVAKSIKDPKKRALKILNYSAMPGSSRHHWGTDLDFNYLSDDYFTHGQGKKIYAWLQENAATYGFCQPYSDKKDGRTGYNEEKWHWSYMPLSAGFTAAAKAKMTSEMVVGGFKGSETAPDIDIVKNYVLGINPNCFE